MADEKDSSEKTEDPSQYRLEESRKKGDVASSKEFSSVLVLLGTTMTLVLSLVYMMEVLNDYIHWLYHYDFRDAFTEKTGKKIFIHTLLVMVKCVAPVFIASFCFGIFSQVLQFGLLFAPDVLSAKFERINPLKGFKRLFSLKAVAEAIKGIFKFIVILSITFFVLKGEIKSFIGFLHADTMQSTLYAKTLFFKLCASILGGLSVIAGADFFWEKYQHKNKLRQSKQEMKEELKEKEGNPEIRQKIKSIQRELARKRMMQEVPKADVIVTNPTHISVAIKYDSQNMVSPKVTALGTDHMAFRIREVARKHNIPMVENVPLARALYQTVKIGDYVPRNLYKAVAEVLAFVYRMNKKRRALNWGRGKSL